MTIAQLLECVLCKACTLGGYEGDATPFNGVQADSIEDLLLEHGYEKSGVETLYNGRTGEQMEAKIFIGPTFYYRLKHLVKEKLHSRSRGPYQLLTRQPAEGRSRDGGLRIGKTFRLKAEIYASELHMFRLVRSITGNTIKFRESLAKILNLSIIVKLL